MTGRFRKAYIKAVLLTVKLWLLQDLDFSDVHIMQWVDSLAGLFYVFTNAVWDPGKMAVNLVSYSMSQQTSIQEVESYYSEHRWRRPK